MFPIEYENIAPSPDPGVVNQEGNSVVVRIEELAVLAFVGGVDSSVAVAGTSVVLGRFSLIVAGSSVIFAGSSVVVVALSGMF